MGFAASLSTCQLRRCEQMLGGGLASFAEHELGEDSS